MLPVVTLNPLFDFFPFCVALKKYVKRRTDGERGGERGVDELIVAPSLVSLHVSTVTSYPRNIRCFILPMFVFFLT